MSAEKLGLFWESELVKNPNGSVKLTAINPMDDMSTRQAARALGVSTWTIADMFKAGILKGFKPGARRARRDGKASNAKLRICSESVLAHKQACEAEAKKWQEREA